MNFIGQGRQHAAPALFLYAAVRQSTTTAAMLVVGISIKVSGPIVARPAPVVNLLHNRFQAADK